MSARPTEEQRYAALVRRDLAWLSDLSDDTLRHLETSSPGQSRKQMIRSYLVNLHGLAAVRLADADQTKHTPGPWEVADRDHGDYLHPKREIFIPISHRPGSRYHLADIVYPTTTANTVGAVEREANARLMAAAPALADALEACLDQLDRCGVPGEHSAVVAGRAALQAAGRGDA